MDEEQGAIKIATCRSVGVSTALRRTSSWADGGGARRESAIGSHSGRRSVQRTLVFGFVLMGISDLRILNKVSLP